MLNCLAACEDAQMLETIRVRAIVLLTRIRSQIGLSGKQEKSSGRTREGEERSEENIGEEKEKSGDKRRV